MKKQFQSLTEKGRWLLATLTLIFTLGIGQIWAAVPADTYYSFTGQKSANAEIVPTSGVSTNKIKCGSSGSVASSSATFANTSYSYGLKLGNSAAKGCTIGVSATTTNPAHIILFCSGSGKDIYLYDGSTKLTTGYTYSAPSVVDLTTTKTGTLTMYASGDVYCYYVQVLYEGNDNIFTESLSGEELSLPATITSGSGELCFFRPCEVPITDGKFVWGSNTSGMRRTVSFKSHVSGTLTVGIKNTSTSTRTASVYAVTDYKTLGSAIETTSSLSANKTATIEVEVTKGTYYAIGGSGAGVQITSLTLAPAAEKHHVTYSLGGDYGTTPTQADVAEGAKFNLHNGTTGITPPTGKQFGGWNDGSTTYAGGAEYTMGTLDVTLTAVWENAKTDPTATFSAGAYVVGADALDLSSLWTDATSDGAVTYALKVASDDATVSGTSFTATKAGSYVVVATQAATATYNALVKEATITVTWPATGEATITYNLDVTNKGTTLQTLNTTNATSSSISVAASNSLLFGGLGKSSDKGSHNGTRTLGINTLAEETADKYFGVTFTVADGHMFTPSAISLKVLTIGGNATSYKAVLTDGTNSIVGTVDATNDSEKTLGSWSGLGTTTLTGDVTLKLYAWYTTSGSYNAYRLSTPITIAGTVAAIPSSSAPVISAPDADQAAVYDLNDVIAPLEITASGYPTPTYQWYSNSSASTTGATAIEGAQSASYTPASNVASDLYYYCVASNSQGSATSHYFHVTVNAPAVPTIYTETTALTLTSNKIATASETFTFSGANLGDDLVKLVLASEVDGITLSTASVTPTAGAIADTEVTVSYKSLLDVAEATVDLYIKQGETTLKTIVLTYSSTAGIEDLTSISAATTWNWTSANSSTEAVGSIDANNIVVLANYTGWVDEFNANAIAGRLQYVYRDESYAQGHSLKFNTTIPGRVSVKFSNTGKKDVARAPRITASDGVYAATEGSVNTKEADKLTYSHNVAAGDVLIEGFEMSDPIVLNMLRFYEVKFLPTHTLSFEDGGTIADMTIAEGEDAVLPEVAAADVPEGKSFKGWYDGDNKVGDAGDAYTMGTSDKTLTAKFQILCTTPTIAWATAPANSKSLSGTQDVSVTLTGYAGAVTWISSDENVATISGSDENATITYVGEGTTTITAKFVIPEEQALCEGTYQVTKEITLQDCPEPAALQYEIARFQVPGCGIDHNHALTNDDVARDNCAVTVTNGVGGSSSNWYQNTTNNLWYAKFQSSGEVVLNVSGGFEEGDIVHVYMRAVNGNGLKLKKSEVEIKTTQNDNAEVDLEYEVLSTDVEDDGSLDFVRVNSNTYINRVVVVRPPCRIPSIAWATEPAKKVHVGDADGTATITSNYVAGVTYTSSNPAVATVSGNGTNTVTIHYVADGTTTITASVAGSGDPGDKFCTEPVSISKEIRVIGAAPASGSLYKFNVKTLTSGVYLFDTYPASMEMTTENYMSELEGGELTASVTGGAQRLFIDNSGYGDLYAFVFSGGAGGLLTLNMDYPLAAGDVIKYQVISGASDKLKLSNAANSDHNTLLVGTGNTNVQTFEVPAAWAGATILKIERSNNTARIPYFEVYRRPALTGISLANATVAVGAQITPAMTMIPNNGFVADPVWKWSITSGSEYATINATTGAVTGVAPGDATVLVELEGRESEIFATCNVHVIQEYVQTNVEESIVWDWSKAGVSDIQLSDNTDPKKYEWTLLAKSIAPNPNFASDKLMMSSLYLVRNSQFCQGQYVKFNTTVPGTVKVTFGNTGNNGKRTVRIAGKFDGNVYSTNSGNNNRTTYIAFAPAGEVLIEAIQLNDDGTFKELSNVQIDKIEFNATPDYTRNVTNNIGTLCVDHNVLAGGALGATFYQIASRNELYDYKIDFEEVLPNEELKAGQPYIFQSNTGKIELFYGETEADAPVAVRGMIGSFVDTQVDIDEENKSNILYIASNKLWNCEDLVGGHLEVVANRAYIVMSGVPTYADYQAAQTSNPAPRRRVTLGKDEAQVVTGFGELETSETPVKVLINGQIFIIRGEKMFDVTGKLVK